MTTQASSAPIRRTAAGAIDTGFYRDQAHALRSAAVYDLFARFARVWTSKRADPAHAAPSIQLSRSSAAGAR